MTDISPKSARRGPCAQVEARRRTTRPGRDERKANRFRLAATAASGAGGGDAEAPRGRRFRRGGPARLRRGALDCTAHPSDRSSYVPGVCAPPRRGPAITSADAQNARRSRLGRHPACGPVHHRLEIHGRSRSGHEAEGRGAALDRMHGAEGGVTVSGSPSSAASSSGAPAADR